MKKLAMFSLAVLAVGAMALVSIAQPPGGPEGKGRGEGPPPGRRGGPEGRERGPGGREGHRPPPPPLIKALDTDEDGEISASEIENAAESLKTLDKNDDGKLSREEIRPPFAGHRGGEGGPGRGRGEGPPRRGPDQGRRGGGEDRGGPSADRGGPGSGEFVERLMSGDKNDDGKLSKDEVPERMQRAFDRIDANSDGVIDKAEIEKMVERFRERGGQRRGPGGEDRGDRPERPERPKRPAEKDE